MTLSGIFNHNGLLSDIIRIVWQFSGTGTLLSISGILERMTLETSIDAIKGIAQVAGNIIVTAVLVTSGVRLAARRRLWGQSGAMAGGGAAAGEGTLSQLHIEPMRS